MGNFKAEAASLPVLYGDTPTLYGRPHVHPRELAGYVADARDRRRTVVAVSGVPWEGTITWGSWSGCELGPRTIRHASARYTGFLPEYGVDAFEWLELVDCGDTPVDMQDRPATFAAIEERVRTVLAAGAFPATYGGDHSISFPIIRALVQTLAGPLGVVHLDAHYDNKDEYDGDRYARCCPFRRVLELDGVPGSNFVHVGIRGPRNMKSQWEYARDIGATTLSINDIRARGMDAVIREAFAIASRGTRGVYVTVCSDVLDAAHNPGGPTDPNGITAHELFRALHYCGGRPETVGWDMVEIYPPFDVNHTSAHVATWALLHLLAGMAQRGQERAGSGM